MGTVSEVSEGEQDLFLFRGGPLDGEWRTVWLQPPGDPLYREQSFIFLDGEEVTPQGGLDEAQIAEINRRGELEHYLLVDDNVYLHESLVTDEHDPPERWRWGGPETELGARHRVLPAPA